MLPFFKYFPPKAQLKINLSITNLWLPAFRRFSAATRRCQLSGSRAGSGGELLLSTNKLIAYHAKTGSLATARHLFDEMPKRDSVSYNSLLSGYSLYGFYLQTIELFRLMIRSSTPLTALSLTPVIRVCSTASDDLFSISQTIRCCVIRRGFDSYQMVSSSLVNMYMNFGQVNEARFLFDGFCNKDVVLWNVMIKGYVQLGLGKEALNMFVELQCSQCVNPDEISVRCLMTSESLYRNKEQVQAYGVKSCLIDEWSDVLSWNKTISLHAKAEEDDDVLSCFKEMRRLDIKQDKVTFVIVLNAISHSMFPEVGEQIHGIAVKGGYCSDVSAMNNLITLYSRMGRIDCARRVFDEIEELDIVSWNLMISISGHSGLEEDSLELFLDMLRHAVIPDQHTLATALRSYSGVHGDFKFHEQVHTWAIKLGLVTDAFVQTSLIDAYAKKGSMKQAETVYSELYFFNQASLNALLTGYLMNGSSEKVLYLFILVQRDGKKLYSSSIITTVLKACSALIDFQQGKQVHAHAAKLGFVSDICVSSALLDVYVKCGSIEDAIVIFADIDEPDDVAWTTMISGCAENGNEHYAFRFYLQMRQSGINGDEYITASIIKACCSLTALHQGKQIHANAIKMDHSSSTFPANSLIDMYRKCGKFDDSQKIFKRMDVKTLASWNLMVLCFAQHGDGKTALELFENMKLEGIKPDKITFIGLLSACSHSGLVSEAYNYFHSMKNDYGIEPDIEHYSCIVDVLSRKGLIRDAEHVIDSMPFAASASMYKTLLCACQTCGNRETVSRITAKLLVLDLIESSDYILLSNIHASANKWNEVVLARETMRRNNSRKDPGCSWVEY